MLVHDTLVRCDLNKSEIREATDAFLDKERSEVAADVLG